LITTSTDEDVDELNARYREKDIESMTKKELQAEIKKFTKKMETAAAELNFEMAAEYRDRLKELKIALRDYDA
jgi:excinuclease ABC subunit B